jgi:hypothetical protein
MDPTTETKNPILTFDEEFDTSTSDAARRVLDTPDIPPTVPASLSDALRQDGRALFESFVPKSQAAAERRGEIAANIRNFGKNVLSVAGITVVLGAGLAVAASAVDTYILAPVEVGKVEVTQKTVKDFKRLSRMVYNKYLNRPETTSLAPIIAMAYLTLPTLAYHRKASPAWVSK